MQPHIFLLVIQYILPHIIQALCGKNGLKSRGEIPMYNIEKCGIYAIVLYGRV